MWLLRAAWGDRDELAAPAGRTCLIRDSTMAPEPSGREASENRVQNHPSLLHSPQLRAGAPQNDAVHSEPEVPADSGSSEVKPLKP